MKSRLKAPRAVQVLEKRYHGLHETQHRQRSRQSPFLVVFVPGSVESPLIRIEREDHHGRKEHELFSVEILPASNVPLMRELNHGSLHYVVTPTAYEVGEPARLIFGKIPPRPSPNYPWED